jgi:L-seryl-tRNA(Ser) seleniumtransferase
MLRAAPAELRRRADAFAAALEAEGWSPRVIPADGQAGGGSLPGVGLPGWAVALGGPDVDGLAARLRTGTPAVLGRVADGRLLLDLRTVPPGDEAPLRAALAAARGSWPG